MKRNITIIYFCLFLLGGCVNEELTEPKEQDDASIDIAKQTAEDAILPAMEVYSYFELYPLTLNHKESKQDGLYYRIQDKNLDTFDELRAFVSDYFSEEITQQLLSNMMYTDIDGYLYAKGSGRKKREDIEHVSYSLVEMSDDLISYQIVITYAKESQEPINPKTLYFIREQQKGKWVFTAFPFFW